MKHRAILAVIGIVIALSMTAVVVKTDTNVRLHQIEVQTKQQELDLLQEKLEHNNEVKAKTQQELDKKLKENQELQKQIEALQARKAEEQRIAAEQAQNAVMAAPEAPQTTSCEQLGTRLASLGVSASDMTAALYIAQRESGCNSGAINASSGACGEFQSLPCGKWGSPGTDQYLQNAINYAVSRYGGWQQAYSYWQSNHWW